MAQRNPNLPHEAKSLPTGESNELPPARQRSGTPLTKELSAGPRIGPSGNYLPAIYHVGRRNHIREDR